MSYQNLIDQGKLRKDDIGLDQINTIIERAYRNIKSAQTLLNDNDEEGAFRFAYDAMLAAGRVLVFSYGFRPRAAGSHKIVAEFAKEIFGDHYETLVKKFDKARKKRNYLIYGISASASETEARNAIENAQELIEKIKQKIQDKNPQKELFG